MSTDFDVKPVTHNIFFRTLKEMGDVMIESARDSTKRLDSLTARVAALEARPALKYLGGHQPGREYSAASVVTRNGGLFVAKVDTSATPGDSADWQLAVRRGGA